MKKISTSSLQFENKPKITNMTSNSNINASITKLNSNAETEIIDSFGDDVLEFFGSNNITKGSAIEVLEEEMLNFIDKDDIDEAYRSGINGENINVILKNGEKFQFIPDGNSYKLSRYSNSSGETCSFENGLYELWNNIYGGNNMGTSISLDDILLYDDTLVLTMKDDVKIYYDVSDDYKITSFSLNGNSYAIDEIEKGLNFIRDERINRAIEKSETMGRIIPGMSTPEEDIKEAQERYNINNIERFSIRDGEVTLHLKDSNRPIYINFDGSTSSSVKYPDSSSIYLDGYIEKEI